MSKLEKPRANELTELLAFTVYKLKLRGKVIVWQSCSRRTWFNCGQLWAKQNESDILRKNKNKPRSKFKEARILAVVNKGQNKRKKRASTKKKQTEEKVVSRKHSFHTMTEESDD